MKFTVSKKEIESSINKISGLIAKDGNLLKNFHVSVKDGNLTIAASDMDNIARSVIAVSMQEPGTALIGSKRLSDICSKVAAENIIFEKKIDQSDDALQKQTGKILIKGDAKKSAKYEIAFSDEDGFPVFNRCEYIEKIDGNILKAMIDKTFHAASKDGNRYIYNGLQLHSENGIFSATATDGKRLATRTTKLKSNIKSAVVHEKFLRELLKNISDEMYIGMNENEIYVKSGNVELTSRLLEGKFPDYKKIIPSSGEEIEVNRKSLIESLKQIMIMTESPSFQIVMSGNTIRTNEPDIGQSEVEIDFTCPCEIGMNSQFLMDALQNIESENFIMRVVSNVAPVVFVEDGNYLNLVMPMKV